MMGFRSLGEGVKICPTAILIEPEVIDIGPYSRIDDFTVVFGGQGISIGRYVHIASFVSVIGGGELEIGDYVGVSAGVRIVTGTDHYAGGARMCSALPPDQRSVVLGKIVIKRDGFIGTNAVIHPNVIVGEGAVVGSCSLVLKDCEPWTIYTGIPCKPIGKRPRVNRPDI